MSGLNERSKTDFLVYANSVIKSRAIPSVEDNLKPIHRKILYTLWEDKVFSDKPTKKCATEAGRVLAYSPHGDASVYGAMVRLAQWWKLRYPLLEMQGNCGNLLGDGAAASRYTECRLSPIGMLMLEGLNKNAVDFKPNYDETTTEPVTLPSKFPFLLCGNNSGIAVGMSSDLVSHNFTEVMGAINHYMKNPNTCTVAELMQFIKGPDFPTGGFIANGEDLLNIYSTGRGSIKVYAHYEVSKKGAKNVITFKDLPYGIEIDSGVKTPLKKLVLDDGYDIFEDIDVRKAGPRNFDISITLSKGADIAKALEILYAKTRLSESIKINQTIIVDGEPKLLNLKELIAHWVGYRSRVIQRIASADYAKTNHKLTVTIGLQKCMSNIDLLVSLVRNAENRTAAKTALMREFVLNDEQAEAVLDMKLSRLSKLDLTELNDEEKSLRESLARLKDVLDNESTRYNIISEELREIKALVGKDDRITEVQYNRPVEGVDAGEPLVKKEWQVYVDGLHGSINGTNVIANNIVDTVFAYNADEIFAYSADGEMGPTRELAGKIIGAMAKGAQKKIVTVTAAGNIKVSAAAEYKFKKTERLMKLKDGDTLKFAALCDDSDYLMLLDAQSHVIKLPIKDLPVAGKLTLGVKSGFTSIVAASIVNDSSTLLFVTKDNKGKFTMAKDFGADSRGNKGQALPEGTVYMKTFDDGRESVYLVPKTGNVISLARTKLSLKGRTAIGASVSTRVIVNIV